MWGDPHISVGRRVERPIQCRKVADTSQADRPYPARCLCLSRHDRYLSARISSAVGEKPVVVATRAERADGDFLNPRLGSMFGDQRSQIDLARPRHRLPGQLLAHLDTHLVTPTADRGSQVNRELIRRKTMAG